ncbi:MAG: hypothetical protein JRD69_09245 [Deltaproteobacteria bacterium]|nr:hypothetical protein [Deltaproteobacteria bacterium]
MPFIVEHECPQCGAPVELEETNRLLRCPYCGVKNYLFAGDMFRFVLPDRAPGKEIIYVPYMRFKGNVFLCKNASIDHRVVDITRLGVPLSGIPLSLGFRPQAMKMKFVTHDMAGSILSSTLKSDDILDSAGAHTAAFVSKKFFHRAYIGEALSRIYLPLYMEGNKLFDAITNQFLVSLPADHDVLAPLMDKCPRWNVTFSPTICPNCGWDLDGEKDSVVLTCSNCDSAWQASDGRFAEVSFNVVPGSREGSLYLPFWKISAETKNEMGIRSYADFIRVTNQPKVVQKDWENRGMSYWIPAFKIRPRIYMHLSKQLTISQEKFETGDRVSRLNLYPVTLPHSEAVQSLKITLADSIMSKEKLFPHKKTLGYGRYL